MVEVALSALLAGCVPDDHSDQVGSDYFVDKALRSASKAAKVLDLGCGTGMSADTFLRAGSEVEWHGVDVEASPEAAARSRTDVPFHTFDGVNLPFESETFDIVFSKQVFEHVRFPEPLLAEVQRILKPGGSFIGSVSALESYHSLSLWNYTPYGWITLVRAAGMETRELRPGIDSIALIRRAYLGRPAEANSWFVRSPLNTEIDEWGEDHALGARARNLRKLEFCGHLVFWCVKP